MSELSILHSSDSCPGCFGGFVDRLSDDDKYYARKGCRHVSNVIKNEVSLMTTSHDQRRKSSLNCCLVWHAMHTRPRHLQPSLSHRLIEMKISKIYANKRRLNCKIDKRIKGWFRFHDAKQLTEMNLRCRVFSFHWETLNGSSIWIFVAFGDKKFYWTLARNYKLMT